MKKLSLVLLLCLLLAPVGIAGADPVPTPELPSVPTAIPVPTLDPSAPQIDADLFWDLESWRVIVSYARSIFVFAERYRFFTLLVVLGATVLLANLATRMGSGGAYFYDSSDDED